MARMTTLERLNKRGIVAWEVDGVLARFTKAQSASADYVAVARPFVDLVAAFAVHIRQRVQQRGDLAGQQPAPSGKKRILLSRLYADAVGVGGAAVFTSVRDADALHTAAGHPRATLTVTGGMWAGLQVRGTGGTGNTAAIIDFAGSSEGRGNAKMGLRRVGNATRKTVVAVAAAKERNQWKAGAIFDKMKVHPLLHTDAEMAALAEAVTQPFADAAGRLFGDQVQVASGWLGGDTTLASRLAAVG